jgi:hypothetical protein
LSDWRRSGCHYRDDPGHILIVTILEVRMAL